MAEVHVAHGGDCNPRQSKHACWLVQRVTAQNKENIHVIKSLCLPKSTSEVWKTRHLSYSTLTFRDLSSVEASMIGALPGSQLLRVLAANGSHLHLSLALIIGLIQPPPGTPGRLCPLHVPTQDNQHLILINFTSKPGRCK